MTDTKKIITEVLTIIGFDGDKQQFADEMLVMAEKQTLAECIKTLPADKRAQLVHLLNTSHRKQESSLLLQRYITKETYLTQLEKSTNELFFDYLETIDKTLDEATRSKLEKYLQSVVAES